MTARNLQQLIDAAGGDVVRMLRDAPHRPYVSHPVVAPEFSNWRDEQRAWRDAVVLMDQTHHMDALYIRGAGAHDLIAHTSVNSSRFPVDTAKQYVAVTSRGHVIGDGIMFREADDEFMYVGRSPCADWLLFNAERGDYSVEVEVDRRSFQYPLGRQVQRKYWRFQIQGPRAWELIEKLNGGPVESTKFFHESWMTIEGVQVRTLRHGMAGAPGLELWGPYETYLQTRDAILRAGDEFGMIPIGSRSYPTTAIESGWISAPLPAIFTGDDLRPYREWLSAESYEALVGLGGSFVPDTIEPYYLSPWELGYGSFVRFDHDFIGSDALQKVDLETQRRKVTLAWHPEDVGTILASIVAPEGPQYKYLELPLANYATSIYDKVVTSDDTLVGLGLTNVGYTANERTVLSLATVDADIPDGAQLELVWGEPDGGSKKPSVEPHEQFNVRVIVSPVPYSRVARTEYHTGWRTGLKTTTR